MSKHTNFKCNGCKCSRAFLLLDSEDMPTGYKLYECVNCGAVGVKNEAEALHIPDSDVCRCNKCGSWRWQTKPCHTCQLIASK
jgi:hypothetical protein